MNTPKYLSFSEVNLKDLISILNEEKVRSHLIPHEIFDTVTAKKWVDEKINVDSIPGCRIRAIVVDGSLAGWCGIQKDDEHYEIAIVLSKLHWGSGISIYRDLISWAKELGHQEIVIHLLETRSDYKFLKKMATKTRKTKMLGSNFKTYYIKI